MKVAERATPVAAVFAAFSTLACCLPLGLLGAAGMAGIAVRAAKFRYWFFALAFVFLIVGSVQIYSRKACAVRSKATVVTFWIAVALVLFIFLFPQIIANVLAGLS